MSQYLDTPVDPTDLTYIKMTKQEGVMFYTMYIAARLAAKYLIKDASVTREAHAPRTCLAIGTVRGVKTKVNDPRMMFLYLLTLLE